MIRLIDYCSMKPHNGRNFLDGFLDLLVEEMDTRKFDPRNRPLRETVSQKVMKLYGGGCDPEIVHMTAVNEDKIISIQEDPLGEKEKAQQETHASSNDYRALPQRIDNRERYMVDVVSFNAERMILDLLDDRSIFGDTNNLVVNKSNPFLPYQNEHEFADEIMDGSWYRETIKRLKTFKSDPFKEEVEFILPLILYVDKTGTTMNQRCPLEPFMLTTAVIRRSLRTDPTSWRPLGFVPDLETKSSAEAKFVNTRNRGATAQAYHHALGLLLKGVEEVQNKGIVHWLRIGEHKKKVRIRPEVAFVINDGKSADMITTRLPSFHPSRRVSRSCETLQGESDQVTKECKFVHVNRQLQDLFKKAGMSAKEVQEDPACVKENSDERPTHEQATSLVEEAKQKLLDRSFHPVRNAFLARCIRFGLDPQNIWGANPIDLMHAFQSGILMYLVKMVLDNVPPKRRMELDRLVHKLFHGLRCKERKNYPRMNFSKGFTKLTMLTSDEWAGKLFVILIVLHAEQGKRLFEKANTFSKDDVSQPMHTKTLKESAETFQEWANQKHQKWDDDQHCSTGGRPETLELEDEEVKLAEEKRRKKTKSEDIEEMIEKCSANDFLQLAEALLCFHAWCKLGVNRVGQDGRINEAVIGDSVARLLAMVRHYCPRKKGNGWKLQKFHDILHLARDMGRFGPPCNFDAGPMESGLRFWAKLPAMTSQTRGHNTFVKQVASRTFEFQCFSKAMRRNGILGTRKLGKESAERKRKAKAEDSASDCGTKPNVGGTRYRIYYNRVANQTDDGDGVATYPPSTAMRKRKGCGLFPVSPVIENFLRFQPKEDHDNMARTKDSESEYWELRTELAINLVTQPEARVTFRSHPNYNNEGPWYDWALVDFGTPEGTDNGDTSGILPAKLLAFAEDPVIKDKTWILVHGCNWRTDKAKDSVLIEHWELAYHDISSLLPAKSKNRRVDGSRTAPAPYLAPQLTWVEPTSIVRPCLVVEQEPGLHENVPLEKNRMQNRVFLVKDRKSWPAKFTSEVVEDQLELDDDEETERIDDAKNLCDDP